MFQIPKFYSYEIICNHAESYLVQSSPTIFLQMASIIAGLNVTDRSN